MPHSSTLYQEPTNLLDLVTQLGHFALNSKLRTAASEGPSPLFSNYSFLDGVSVAVRRPTFYSSLSLSSRGKSSSYRGFLNEFNRFVRLHCERIPLGFASVRVDSSDGNGDSNGLKEEQCDVLVDDGLNENGLVGDCSKKVLILMSDTGGGHRASAEAIKAAFHEEFGDEYQVNKTIFI